MWLGVSFVPFECSTAAFPCTITAPEEFLVEFQAVNVFCFSTGPGIPGDRFVTSHPVLQITDGEDIDG